MHKKLTTREQKLKDQKQQMVLKSTVSQQARITTRTNSEQSYIVATESVASVTVNRQPYFHIPLDHIEKILKLYGYPKERLLDERACFRDLYIKGQIPLRLLKQEARALFIDWRLFLLDSDNLQDYINNIEETRIRKLQGNKLAINRNNPNTEELGIPLRLFDRLADMQDYCGQQCSSQNALLNKYGDRIYTIQELAGFIVADTCIDISKLRRANKNKVLGDLIQLIEKQQIGVSRCKKYIGLIPTRIKEIQKTYEASSGFSIHDEFFPYILLPSMTIEDGRFNEATGRQIYTLLFLVVSVAIGYSNVIIRGQIEELIDDTARLENFIYDVVAEIMLPKKETECLKGDQIDDNDILDLSKECKLTPRAVTVILQRRGILDKEYKMQRTYFVETPQTQRPQRSPRIDTAVKNFYGKAATEYLIAGLSGKQSGQQGHLSAPEAQLLLFGRINKGLWRELKSRWGL